MDKLLDFVWNALLSGSIGNAGYDALKNLLGGSFGRLADWCGQNERKSFDDALSLLLDSNAQLRTQLESLANIPATVQAGNFNTGRIVAGGNVHIGNINTTIQTGEAALRAAEESIPEQAQAAIRMAFDAAAAAGLPRVEARGRNLVEVTADGVVRIVKSLAPEVAVPTETRKRELG